MNGPLFHSGCPGAVHVDGSPSKRYCEGTGYDKKVYPWWKQCCIWDGKKCQRSKYCLFLLQGRLGRATSTVESVQDFLIKLDMKPCMHLVEISIISLNLVIFRPTKIMNRADKNWAQF